MQRIEAHLENVGWGEDGEKLCASAPHDFYERHFDHPDSCANWVSYIIASCLLSHISSLYLSVRRENMVSSVYGISMTPIVNKVVLLL